MHLHSTSDVGTTYKRPLRRFHLSRDNFVPRCFTIFTLIDSATNCGARLTQLGTLVISTGADALSIEELGGALLSAADTKDAAIREGWRDRGAAFFQNQTRGSARKADRIASRGEANNGGQTSAAGDTKPQ